MTAIALEAARPRWWRSRSARRFASHRLALLGLAMITLLTLACAFGPALLPYDFLHIDLRGRFSPPLSGQHYLGTDPLGRDIAAGTSAGPPVLVLAGYGVVFAAAALVVARRRPLHAVAG